MIMVFDKHFVFGEIISDLSHLSYLDTFAKYRLCPVDRMEIERKGIQWLVKMLLLVGEMTNQKLRLGVN